MPRSAGAHGPAVHARVNGHGGLGDDDDEGAQLFSPFRQCGPGAGASPPEAPPRGGVYSVSAGAYNPHFTVAVVGLSTLRGGIATLALGTVFGQCGPVVRVRQESYVTLVSFGTRADAVRCITCYNGGRLTNHAGHTSGPLGINAIARPPTRIRRTRCAPAPSADGP